MKVKTHESSFQDIWSPSGQPTRATFKCTIAQFGRLLELAPEGWVKATFLDARGQIPLAEENARKDGVTEGEIREAKMTGISYKRWEAIAALLGMKVYFGGVRGKVYPGNLLSGYQGFGLLAHQYDDIGAGFFAE